MRCIYVDKRIWDMAKEKAQLQSKNISQVIEEFLKEYTRTQTDGNKHASIAPFVAVSKPPRIREVEMREKRELRPKPDIRKYIESLSDEELHELIEQSESFTLRRLAEKELERRSKHG